MFPVVLFLFSLLGASLAAPHGNCSNYVIIIEDPSSITSNSTIEIIELTDGMLEGTGQESNDMESTSADPLDEILGADSDDDLASPSGMDQLSTPMRRAVRAVLDARNSTADNSSASGNSSSSGNSTCEFNSVCHSDDECGEEGKCLGAFVSKCNCNACVNFVSCEDDSSCGGLKGACNNESRCDCIEGLKTHGFEQFTDALTKLCNKKECTKDGDECFGLPCNSGRCVCNSMA